MHTPPARYAGLSRDCSGMGRAAVWCAQPPDVEPPPEHTGDNPRRWLESRHIAICDRGGACMGLRLGELLGEFVLAVLERLAPARRRPTPAEDMPPLGGTYRSFPRIRRSPFYRRARALQFKRTYGR